MKKVLKPFPYYGGKSRQISFILKHLPDANRLVDLFGGSAVVSINAAYRYKRILYNDVNSELVNFFRVLRNKRDELIEQLELTPVSRDEYHDSYNEAFGDVDAARRTFTKIRQSFGSLGLNPMQAGWSAPTAKNHSLARSFAGDTFNLLEIARIFKRFDIENKDWRYVVSKYGKNNSVVFADPPYDLPKAKLNKYQYDMTKQDHEDLSVALEKAPCSAVVCGYRTDLYDKLYADWERIEHKVVCLNASGKSPERIECLWIKRY